MKQNTHGFLFRPALAAATVLVLALAGAALSAAPPANALAEVGIKNFGQVNEHVFRGPQPRGEDYAQLKRLGVRTLIDLRADRESGAEDKARAAGFAYFNIPLNTKRPATDEQTDHFLRLVNDPANWPVYVHCKGGRHRTGALLAVYRITRDGWTADQAFEEMKRYDFNSGLFISGGGRATQKKFVYDFYERYVASRQPLE